MRLRKSGKPIGYSACRPYPVPNTTNQGTNFSPSCDTYRHFGPVGLLYLNSRFNDIITCVVVSDIFLS